VQTLETLIFAVLKMIEYKLESFELSGLVRDFSALPRHDQLPKDYQVKIMADHGLAFHSSW